MRTRLSVAVVTVLSLVTAGVAAAPAIAATDPVPGAPAQSSPNAPDDSKSQQAGPVTEVTVESHREKLSRLRKEIRDSETAFYEQFDKVNKVPAYETHCTNEIPTDSHISAHVCTPQFIHDIGQDGAESFLMGTPPTLGFATVALRERAFRIYLHETIQREPTLRQAAVDYAVLVKEYQTTRHEKVREK